MRRVAMLLMLAAALALAGCGGDDGGDEAAGNGAEESAMTGDASNGEQVFASAGCGGCHALEAAGTTGTVGPNLDESQPSYDLVVDRVTNGMGTMPAFEDQLTEQEIADVAAFVSESAGA